MAGLVIGIVQGKSCQLPTIARKVPTLSKPESRAKQYSRWRQNERIDQLALLKQLQAVLPENCSCILLGDAEFDGIGLLAALQDSPWRYVCRTAKNTQVFEGGMQFALSDLPVQPDDQIVVPDVLFTLEGYAPVTVMAVCDKGCPEPIYLVTNFDLPDEARHCYKERFQIETFFGGHNPQAIDKIDGRRLSGVPVARLPRHSCHANQL